MECKQCNISFNPKRKNQIFCSKKCRSDFNNDKAYQIRKIDSQQVLSPVIGTSLRTSIDDSTIGKLMVFEHSQNLPIPTRNRAIDLASFDSDVISGFDLEYFTNKFSTIPI